ncbi:MAG: methyl-accepting chemotaxis protein [Candidatus Omnitrophica bacterium]|nr:methyl-accepting chemotaxis protein [Candidatus Omnitrophota bacterium]
MEHKAMNRRRNYFIKKKFQRDFILKFCSLVAVGSIISGVIIFIMSKSTLTTAFDNSRLVVRSTADFILPAVLMSSVIVVLLVGLATIIITLFTSHKIAGPLYRMEQDVKEIAAGNLKVRINLRHGDELKDMAESLEEMVRNLQGNVSAIKSTIFELEGAIDSLNKDDTQASKELIKKINQELDKLKV